MHLLIRLTALLMVGFGAPHPGPDSLAKTYTDAVRKLNEGHARKPGDTLEEELARELPRKAVRAFEQLLEEPEGKEIFPALAQVGEAALDLARIEDFDRIRARMESLAPGSAEDLGVALARERFLLRGMGGLDLAYLEHFAEIFEVILDAYDEVFGFAEWSKVPGKKLRVRVHLESEITRPPHFAPQFPFHSEIDFPVIDAEALRSPTADGKFLFYGLCHELGHVVAMWGRPGFEEDHHAWAHYTGVVIVDHLAQDESHGALLKELRDARWRSLPKLREELAGQEASFEDRSGVLAFLLQLHDAFGPGALGDALNHADEKDRRQRVNHVRYYTFDDLEAALGKTLPKGEVRELRSLWP